ncbi:hypothetical protein [Actinoplanes utahensis]|uniref:DUF3828 domain-containing protein n=1 Tax=Actinoplanes utahensis TaxID=1869 RepID=A0A0A6UFV5_ACTUT|nr:hypothetical protein [Actinoplanes utahensis]KHD74925.1 hypothetical protein MB27_26000 [Actinoplanes utahensis]GIF28571.1 hypothetical protein Aut01nite_15570 [Actinoplanes utahensis]
MPARAALPALALTVAAALTACAGTEPEPPALPDDVRVAYDRFWAAWTAAGETSDPDLPLLAEHVAEPLLSTLRGNLEATRTADRVTRGRVGHRIEGWEADADARRIVDCVDLGGWLLHSRSTGALQTGQLTGDRSQLTEIVLRPYDGRWKATNMYILADRC